MQANAHVEPVWLTLVEHDSYVVMVSYDACDTPILKIRNITNSSLKLDWKEEVVDYITNSKTSLNDGQNQSITLSANSEISGSCDNDTLKIDLTGFDGELEVGSVEIKVYEITIN